MLVTVNGANFQECTHSISGVTSTRVNDSVTAITHNANKSTQVHPGRHGARAKFYRFYDCIFDSNFQIKLFDQAFLKLALLSGCSFNEYFCELKSNPSRQSFRSANASLVEPVQKLVLDLFSQPLSLQELSVMVIRQCIGCPQLWAKIDSLPLLSSIRDKIKLKTYSQDKRTDLDIKFAAFPGGHVRVNLCTSILWGIHQTMQRRG